MTVPGGPVGRVHHDLGVCSRSTAACATPPDRDEAREPTKAIAANAAWRRHILFSTATPLLCAGRSERAQANAGASKQAMARRRFSSIAGIDRVTVRA
jgi:hypothetical protein